jgi:hypothetical protein
MRNENNENEEAETQEDTAVECQCTCQGECQCGKYKTIRPVYYEVYFTDKEYRAGWRNKEKQPLMY